jgi:lipoprotein NlpD
MIRFRLPTVFVLAGLLIGLAGCASRGYHSDLPEPRPAGQEAGVPRPAEAESSYRVKSGDTLHSIAFAAGTDWQTVAARNGIAPPYTIYPGQELKLGVPAAPVAAVPAPQSAPRIPALPAPETRAQPTRQLPPPPENAGAWQWPSAGKLILGFSGGAQPHKGIDVAGSAGDPVVAAKGGTVVYAGDGVRGYGNLLIVKHDALFLSAYAHNSKLLVAEGDVVKGGQRIAEMGDSGTDRTKLHFEVRRQGNPVDPLQVLPKR